MAEYKRKTYQSFVDSAIETRILQDLEESSEFFDDFIKAINLKRPDMAISELREFVDRISRSYCLCEAKPDRSAHEECVRDVDKYLNNALEELSKIK